jgi:small conductance mechanosensitive channel
MTPLDRLTVSVTSMLAAFVERAPYILLGGLFLLLTWWASRVVRRSVRALLARTSTEGHVDLTVAKFASGATFGLGVVVALGIMGVQVSALVTSLGLIGLTLGFALRDVLANTMAGVLLLVQRPFTVGDSITVAGIEGTVRDMRVRDTLLEATDGRMVFMPNNTVFTQPITNSSVSRRRRIEVRFPIPLVADLAEAVEITRQTLAAVPGVLQDAPTEAEYASTRVAIAVLVGHAWVDTSEAGFGRTQHEALVAVAGALGARGLLRR